MQKLGERKQIKKPQRQKPPGKELNMDDDSSYMTGQVLHPNGGEIVNG